MTTNVASQLMQVLYMGFFAVFMIFGFDIMGALRTQAHWKRKQCIFVDFLLTLFWGILFCIVLVLYSDGLLRNYNVLGLCWGMAAYCCILRNRCKLLCQRFAKMILWFISYLKRVVLFPRRWIHRNISVHIKHKYNRWRKNQRLKKMQEKIEEEQMEKII